MLVLSLLGISSFVIVYSYEKTQPKRRFCRQQGQEVHCGNSCSVDETRLALVPLSYQFPEHATEYFAGKGGYEPSRAPGWHDWGNVRAENWRPVLVSMVAFVYPEPVLAHHRFS
jgi:hypothetical protein